MDWVGACVLELFVAEVPSENPNRILLLLSLFLNNKTPISLKGGWKEGGLEHYRSVKSTCEGYEWGRQAGEGSPLPPLGCSPSRDSSAGGAGQQTPVCVMECG